ncbi:MAG: hypothetical protein E7605_09030 [Ruminococcaceae bacterium]|nr:hypothetical protein [Oscillospiraceae bacterium]
MQRKDKLTIVINGRGGVGKDTLCDFTAQFYRVRNISSVDPIKEIARMHGWNGEKDLKSRKFLSDLKRVFTEYNDLPNRYMMAQHAEFLETDEQILFVHIRESDQIASFVKLMEGHTVLTLLIRRDDGTPVGRYGNVSDDDVESYPYDYYYDNNAPLEDTPDLFATLIAKMAADHGLEL